MALNPLTELDAVNAILRNMGEAPVNTLSGSIPMDATQAQNTLSEVSRMVQTRGWFFNRERTTLTPDGTGKVAVPANTLSIKTIDNSAQWPVTVRGGYLYRMTAYNTGTDWSEWTSIKVEVVYGLDFTDLPQAARNYITMKAARKFQADELGDQVNLQEDSVDESRALTELLAEDVTQEPYSLRDNPDVYKVIAGSPLSGKGIIGSYS